MPRKKLTSGIDPDTLDQLVKDLGVRVRVYKSTILPNMKSLESYDQDLNTKLGKIKENLKVGNNMIDFDPIDTVAMFQQQELVEQYKLAGTFHIDEIMVTFLSGITLSPMTRVELMDFEEDFTELIPRQRGTNVDRLKYAACEIVGVFTINDQKVPERYYPEVDFLLTPDGDIRWVGTHRPDDDQIYSIYYKFHPTFRALKAIHRDRYSQFNRRPTNIEAPNKQREGATYVRLPETWILKRDFLIERDKNEYVDPNEDV